MRNITHSGESCTVVEHYFGGCPQCGGNDGVLNVVCNPDAPSFGPVNVCVCDAHRVAWVVGVNLFSIEETDTLEAMVANGEKLKRYEAVEPLPIGAPLPRPGPTLRVIQGGRP